MICCKSIYNDKLNQKEIGHLILGSLKRVQFFGKETITMTSEQCKHKMLEIGNLPGNTSCADCGDEEPPPDFISPKIGIFVCIICSGIHRSLGPQTSNIKSIKLDTMNEDMCEQIKQRGNLYGKEKYEHEVPECWPIVRQNDFPDLREQWIRAKYERLEFVEDGKIPPYSKGSKYGWLLKKEKTGSKWNKRYFILSSQQGYLCYFLKQEDSEPKQRIHASQINLMFVPEEITQRKHSMLLSFPISQGGYSRQRHIFVYAETSFEIVDWYLAIRAARLNFIRPYLYGVDKPVIDHILSRTFLKMGYLHKTGSKSGDSWRRRFVVVDTHKFSYFEKPMDSEPLAEVDIESNNMMCFAMEGTDGTHPSAPTNHVFFVHSQVPIKGRKPVFNFCADTRESLLEWLAVFRKAMKPIEWLEPVKEKSHRISLLSNFSSRCLSETGD